MLLYEYKMGSNHLKGEIGNRIIPRVIQLPHKRIKEFLRFFYNWVCGGKGRRYTVRVAPNVRTSREKLRSMQGDYTSYSEKIGAEMRMI